MLNNFLGYIINPFKKTFIFSGRSTREEFLYFILFNIVILFSLFILQVQSNNPIFRYISGIYLIIALFPTLSLSIRRAQDVEIFTKRIYLMFVLFLISLPILYYFLVMDGLPGAAGTAVIGLPLLFFTLSHLLSKLSVKGDPRENKYGKPVNSESTGVDEHIIITDTEN